MCVRVRVCVYFSVFLCGRMNATGVAVAVRECGRVRAVGVLVRVVS